MIWSRRPTGHTILDKSLKVRSERDVGEPLVRMPVESRRFSIRSVSGTASHGFCRNCTGNQIHFFQCVFLPQGDPETIRLSSAGTRRDGRSLSGFRRISREFASPRQQVLAMTSALLSPSSGQITSDPAASGAVLIDWSDAFSEHSHWLRTVIRSRLGEDRGTDDVLPEVAVAAVGAPNRPTQPEGSPLAVPGRHPAVHDVPPHHGTAAAAYTSQFAEGGPARGDTAGGALGWMLGNERQASIRRALDKLPELDRQILWLKHTENWT